ncbi:precoat protein [Parsley yellow leaf curl virus]|nr:precoat protein [Parsley yellow leaf curl virus]
MEFEDYLKIVPILRRLKPSGFLSSLTGIILGQTIVEGNTPELIQYVDALQREEEALYTILKNASKEDSSEEEAGLRPDDSVTPSEA